MNFIIAPIEFTCNQLLQFRNQFCPFRNIFCFYEHGPDTKLLENLRFQSVEKGLLKTAKDTPESFLRARLFSDKTHIQIVALLATLFHPRLSPVEYMVIRTHQKLLLVKFNGEWGRITRSGRSSSHGLVYGE